MIKGSWRALIWIGLSELFALSLWFSASVIAPELIERWNLDSNSEAWLSASVPIGFVIGALISSYLGIADRFNPRRVFAISAFLGALLNVSLILVDHAFIGILLRILTGVTFAGVYPIAVKILSQWFPKNRGLAIGILIAALTLGSSLPHFIVMFSSSLNWQIVIICSSILALLAAIIVNWVLEDAPVTIKKLPFSFKLIKKVVSNKPVMLANYGYFGHMWELYAMWTWIPIFLTASFTSHSPGVSPWFIALTSLCFYIPRKIILSTEKFHEIMEVERSLIELHKADYGEYTIDLFGESGYRGGNDLGYSSAFYDYWRSTHIVHFLIEKYCNGDMNKLIESYKEWVNNSSEINLQKFFIEKFKLSKYEAKELWLAD